MPNEALTFAPVTPDRWDDLDRLFSQRGACQQCWCMWWRLSRAEFMARDVRERREGMRQIVATGQAPGILAFRDGRPLGWCSVGPRERFGRLEQSPRLRRIDDRPVWSIVCFFVAEAARRQGISEALVKAAVVFAAEQGASIVEAYPAEPKAPNQDDSELYMGVASAFRSAGFSIVQLRPLTVRLMLRPTP
jgi:GNAT superfamily N-acetyltransferase